MHAIIKLAGNQWYMYIVLLTGTAFNQRMCHGRVSINGSRRNALSNHRSRRASAHHRRRRGNLALAALNGGLYYL